MNDDVMLIVVFENNVIKINVTWVICKLAMSN